MYRATTNVKIVSKVKGNRPTQKGPPRKLPYYVRVAKTNRQIPDQKETENHRRENKKKNALLYLYYSYVLCESDTKTSGRKVVLNAK